jgi:hypothetical protein
MPTSAAQISANQTNAQKSTGPVTEIGKSKVAGNAIKHGLFSKNLILADEDPFEYQNLLRLLQSELSPAGILEQTLVERIAVSLWRQKRLIRAETAYIELERTPKNIVAGVNQELNLTYTDNPLSEADLIEFDVDHQQWCQTVLKEYETIDTENLSNIAWFKKSTPLTYQQLLSDARDEEQTPEQFLQDYEEPIDYFIDLARYCREQIKQAEQRPMVLEVAELVKSKRAILKDKLRDALSKYQIMLDNELYKAMKALRETQDWRFKTLTVMPDENGFVLEN